MADASAVQYSSAVMGRSHSNFYKCGSVNLPNALTILNSSVVVVDTRAGGNLCPGGI